MLWHCTLVPTCSPIMVSTHMCTETRPTRALIKVSGIKLIESKLLDQNLLYCMFHRNLTQQIALKLFFSVSLLPPRAVHLLRISSSFRKCSDGASFSCFHFSWSWSYLLTFIYLCCWIYIWLLNLSASVYMAYFFWVLMLLLGYTFLL